MSRLKQCLAKEFEIKDLGQLRYFLGMEIARSKEDIVVSQRKYTLDLLKETGMSRCKPTDIAFVVSIVSQFMHSPCEEHFEAVFRILRYLKATPGKGLFFGKNQQRGIEVYTDADWAGSI